MFSSPKNIICETSTKTHGNMSFKGGAIEEVVRNRETFLKQCKATLNNYVPVLCDHGEEILFLEKNPHNEHTMEHEKGVHAEVVVTQQKNLALFLLTADCIPLSFYDPVTQTAALAHISRATLCRGLIHKTVDFLRDRCGSNSRNLYVHFGPHIRKESYAFPLPLEKVDPFLRPYIYGEQNMAHIDISGACYDALLTSGITKEKMYLSPVDTATSPEHYSYYCMKKGGVATARIATVLMMC